MGFVAGHFGEWLQGLVPDGAGGEVLALVTLACPDRGLRLKRLGAGALRLDQTRPVLSVDQADRFLARLGLPARGHFQLVPEFPPGAGTGMSTAALVALARAASRDMAGADTGAIAPAPLAAACLAIEGASDPLMLPAPDRVLWASRRGQVLADLPAPPDALVLGGFWGAPAPTDPLDMRFPLIADLVADWATGPELPRAAALAQESAARSTALRGPSGDPTAALARDLGALGWVRAHTGSARGLIFAPDASPDPAALIEAGFTGCVRFRTGGRG
ncbi:MAG: propanediol utilization protein [Roseinatronobacter sp.]